MTHRFEPLTGETIALGAAADFEAFFLPSWSYPVPVHFGPVNAACTKVFGDQLRIVLPHETATDPIENAERLFFHLLIIGHEIAHLVHRHMDGLRDQSDEDYYSLELWADFYGAKVAMALATYGSKTHQVVRRFFPNGELFDALDSIGDAAELLVRTVYRKNRRYPHPLLRVGLLSNGVTSFLRHDLGARFDPILHFSVFKRVYASPAVRELMLFEPESAAFDAGPIHRAMRWHRDKQGARVAITPGFRRGVLELLHTTFNQTEDELSASMAARRDELVRSGLLPADDAQAVGESAPATPVPAGPAERSAD